MKSLQLCMVLLHVLISSDVVIGSNPKDAALPGLQLDLKKLIGRKSATLAHSLNYGALQSRNFWKRYNSNFRRLAGLLSELGPTILRIGGTKTEFTTFCPQCEPDFVRNTYDIRKKTTDPYNLTCNDIKNIQRLASVSKAQVLLDINVNIRDDQNLYNPRNLILLLKYLKSLKFTNIWFQLGNEPNAYEHILHKYFKPSTLSNDYIILRDILSRTGFGSSPLFGPEVASPKLGLGVHSQDFLDDFLKAGGAKVLDCVTWHHYYINSKTASFDDFIDPNILNRFPQASNIIWDVLAINNVTKAWCLTETGSSFGGGTEGLSNRYVSGFMLIDKLGQSQLFNISILTRQSLFHGHYALIDEDLNPNPDYWISILYHRLVKSSGNVYKVICSLCADSQRFYAADGVKDGTVVIMAMNLDKTSVLHAEISGSKRYDGYVIMPFGNNLQSQKIMLNGRLLQLAKNGSFPPIVPVPYANIKLRPLSYGFFVISRSYT